jgi:hypothetical protein
MGIPTIAKDITTFFYGGINNLPLVIAGTMLILGLMTANYAMLFFLLGFLVLIPVATLITNVGAEFLLKIIGFGDYFMIKPNDLCNLAIPFAGSGSATSSTPTFVFSSLWMAMISFFFGYMTANAIALMGRESALPDNPDEDQVKKADLQANLRKSQAMTALISIAVAGGLAIAVRLLYASCDRLAGAIPTVAIFGSFGFVWYKALSSVGQDRLSDLFGIANRLLAPGALANQPVACMPVS